MRIFHPLFEMCQPKKKKMKMKKKRKLMTSNNQQPIVKRNIVLGCFGEKIRKETNNNYNKCCFNLIFFQFSFNFHSIFFSMNK